LPWLVDFHTHVFGSGSAISIDPDMLIAQGVTTTADAGSAGCANFEAFLRSTLSQSSVRIRSYLNVCSYGQPGDNFVEDFDPELFCEDKIAHLFRKYPDQLLGLKIRLDASVPGCLSLKPLSRAKALAVKLGVPIAVHASNPPVPMAEILGILEAGDICCHIFHGKGPNTILNEEGLVRTEIRDAQKRGIIFDCANGLTNYNHAVAKAAISQGLLPDVISTDAGTACFNVDGAAKNLPYTMAKYLWLGMSMADTVRAVTETPARLMGLAGRAGTLAEGAFGDLVVMRRSKASPVFLDNFGLAETGDQMLTPLLTIADGKILFRSNDI